VGVSSKYFSALLQYFTRKLGKLDRSSDGYGKFFGTINTIGHSNNAAESWSI